MGEILSYEDRAGKPVRPERRMSFSNLFDIAKEQHEPDWLIREIMECKTHIMLFGDPESGKSLILFDLLLAIVTGRNWRGRPVKQGAVFYLCGEGQAGLGRRVAAWARHNKVDMEGHFYTSDMPASLTEADSAEMVRDTVQAMCEQHGVTPVAVGIDTLARNFGPGDENSAKDIGQFVANIDNYLIGDLGATVITSHHTGHGDKERARGSMSLPGAVDVSYRISKTEKIIQMECKKSKDFDRPAAMVFDLVVETVGHDSRGQAITGATVHSSPTKKFQSGRPILNGNKLKAFDLLVDLHLRQKQHLEKNGRHNDDPVVRAEHWREESAKLLDTYGHGKGSDGWNKARNTMNKAIRGLLEEKHVQYRPNGTDVYPSYLG